jgi:hypothetical protein
MFDALLPSRRNPRGSSVGDKPAGASPPDEVADDRHLALVEDADTVLAAIRGLVEERLPWVSQQDGQPVQMGVVAVGYLERRYRHFAAGTPFATVGVSNWEAAAAVRDALASIARLSEAAWQVGWRGDGSAFRCIRVFPAVE